MWLPLYLVPKYRRPVLIGDVKRRLQELLREKAAELEIMIAQLKVMPDHVYLFVKAPPILPPQSLAQLKGSTSHELRQEFASWRLRLPSWGTRSSYVETAGHISESTVKQYIADHENR